MGLWQSEGTLTAADVVNKWTYPQLEAMFRKLGDEPESEVVAQAICEWRGRGRRRRKIHSTLELRYVIEEAITRASRHCRRGAFTPR